MEKTMTYQKATVKCTKIILDVIGEVSDHWNNGYTLLVKKENASHESTYRVKPDSIEYIN